MIRLALALLPLAVCFAADPGDSPNNKVRRFERVVLLEEDGVTSANVTIGDVDGDGDLDVVLAKGRHWPLHNRVRFNDGDGGFKAGGNVGETADRTYTASIADLDGDGDLDIAVSNDRPDPNRVFVNAGDGSFSPAGTFGQAEWKTRNMTLADLNGDDRPDAILANRGGLKGAPSFACLNDGSAGFPDCRELPTTSATTIVADDFDDDGNIDLAVPHRDRGQGVLLWGDGSGEFLEQTAFGLAQSNARTAAAGDLDGDGLPDLVVGDEQRGVFVIKNRGRRKFFDPVSIVSSDRTPYSIVLGDLNRDGLLDVVIGYREAIGSILFNDDSGKEFREVPWNDGAGAVYGMALGDLDGDGWDDIAGARSGAPNAVWFNTPSE